MRNFVEGLGKVKQNCVNLGHVVHSSHPVVDCLNELRFTRQSRLESELEVENDVMLVQVFHILLRMTCSITLQRMQVSDMGM